MGPPRIEVTALAKSYGKVTALTDVCLTVPAGCVLGVLGHNGAGKTTLIDILATRTRPTAGSAVVCGWDVVQFGHHVRRHIGLVGQFAALDEAMSGRANLILLARLLGATKRAARDRAGELIGSFGMAGAAERKVRTYSGGMRRRIDIAASLLGRPDVLFLDEPTTGLDPVSRAELWRAIDELAGMGTTVVLTTQDLAEADRLATEVVVLAMGSIVARGTPAQLKAGLGQRTASVRLAGPELAGLAATALGISGMTATHAEQRDPTITVRVGSGGDISSVVRTLDRVGVEILDLTLSEPTLDDVYLALHPPTVAAAPVGGLTFSGNGGHGTAKAIASEAR